MRHWRAVSIWVTTFVFFSPFLAHATPQNDLLLDALINNLTHPSPYVRTEALKVIGDLGNPSAIPALIELLRFEARFQLDLSPTLERLTGEKQTGWHKWVEWLQQHEEIHPNPGFLAWKSYVYARIDPAFGNFYTLACLTAFV